jgi:hypothetical protein
VVEETGENHRAVASHLQALSHNVVSSTPRHERNSTMRSRPRRSLSSGHNHNAIDAS